MNVTATITWLVLATLVLTAACRVERAPALSPFAADTGAADGDGDSARGSSAGSTAPAPDSNATGAIGSAAAGGSAPAEGAGSSGEDSPPPDGGSAGSSAAEAGAGASSGAGAGGAAGTAVEPFDSDAAMTGGSGDRCAPKVEGCNPVTNDGCPPAMQCAVDPLAEKLTGYCIFTSPPMPGSCFNSGVTESCPPAETCFEFACRKLCFCDDDCKEGQCCVDNVGTLGFKVCGEC